MESQSINQMVESLQIVQPELYAWAKQQGFTFPSEETRYFRFTPTERERLKTEIAQVAAEMKILANFASDLLTLPSKVASRSAANLKHWQNNQQRPKLKLVGSALQAITAPNVIDKYGDARPYDAFLNQLSNPLNLAKEHVSILYHVNGIMNDLNTLFSETRKLSPDDKRQMISRVQYGAKTITYKSSDYKEYLKHHLSEYKNKQIPSELNPYSLSACRYCQDVIYPAVTERSQELTSLLERFKRKETIKVVLEGLERQGNVTAIPGITPEGDRKLATVKNFISDKGSKWER